jgi:6-phosphogluconate dehydrogenase
MDIGMVGLGRMGANMVRRLAGGGHSCVVFDLDPHNVAELAAEPRGRGAGRGVGSLAELVAELDGPRHVWVMVPAGDPTERTVAELGRLLGEGDAIVDGGNSFYKDDARRARELAQRGVHYVDCGTSGGVWGAERGYCLMIGGAEEPVRRLEPVFRTLAPGRGSIERTPGWEGRKSTAEEGWVHCGPAGAGHFVKMVHNGIEYGLMQAYAEGFDLLRNANAPTRAEELRYDVDLADVAEVWRRGSVVGSWLLDLTSMALAEDANLSDYSGHVSDSGEGRWTVQTAVEDAVPAEVLTAALYARFRSRQEHTFAEKVLSAMRHKFGGHVERPAGG